MTDTNDYSNQRAIPFVAIALGFIMAFMMAATFDGFRTAENRTNIFQPFTPRTP